MTLKPRDPLLTTARLFLTFLIGAVIVVGGAMLFAIPAVVIFRAHVLAQITEEVGRTVGMETIYLIAGIMLLIATMAALAFVFLRNLRQIVDSVSIADPFAPINATRLARMGWITLAIEGLSLPVGALGSYLESQLKEATVDFGLSIGGLLLALVLFILARIFRQGAAMREDLEGTV